jgi:hypothetical protein
VAAVAKLLHQDEEEGGEESESEEQENVSLELT